MSVTLNPDVRISEWVQQWSEEWARPDKNALDRIHFRSQLCWRLVAEDQIDCPRCNKPVIRPATYCGYCGQHVWMETHS